MKERQTPHITINGLTLEDDRIHSLRDMEDVKMYYLEALEHPNHCMGLSCRKVAAEHDGTLLWVERGLLHKTHCGAVAFCKARIGCVSCYDTKSKDRSLEQSNLCDEL